MNRLDHPEFPRPGRQKKRELLVEYSICLVGGRTLIRAQHYGMLRDGL